MSDIMRPQSFNKLMNWILEEYKQQKTIFGVPEAKFFKVKKDRGFEIFGNYCETPLGPAAGPHTQLTQNIVTSYLTGGRFIELKTIQIMDELEIEKPCIEATDEGYNTEWSTELTVPQAYDEYIKGWIILHVLKKMLQLSEAEKPGFIFNMSVGYDLKGIKSPKIDTFINELIDAKDNAIFNKYLVELQEMIKANLIPGINDPEFVNTISSEISNSITLSTMHGCPPEDQEKICDYLMTEKNLHTFLKLNPTLLGYDYVKDTLAELGYEHIHLKETSFTHDMQYSAAIKMLKKLIAVSKKCNLEFGMKLSNTLAVINDQGMLPTDEMYMSGRALYPLTINLASKLSNEFDGKLPISYAGGAAYENIEEIYQTGIKPLTMATNLLKPGGYSRFHQLALQLEKLESNNETIDLHALSDLASKAVSIEDFTKEAKSDAPMKINGDLPLFNCYVAPCTIGCPINQDIPEYIKLVKEERYNEAFQLIYSKNPLPFITGHICEHNCMLKCVRNDYDYPVLIRSVKRIAAERGYKEFLPPVNDEKDIKVAIIGAGPAGLSAAAFLVRYGFDITIFDKTDKPGGMVRHGIPNFRIPSEAIDFDVNMIKRQGVKFNMNCDPQFDLITLKNEGFQHIILAIGAWKSRDLGIDIEQSKMMDAIEFLQKFNREPENLNPGKNIAIVGGGNSAMDAARAAMRLETTKKVYILYRRTIKEMPADREELDNAIKDGIIFKELALPEKFENGKLVCQNMKLGSPDESGRRRPEKVIGEFSELDIDFVIPAIGELTDLDLLAKNNIKLGERNSISTSQYNETSLENVYICGDANTGPASVVEAIADAGIVVDSIIEKEGLIPDYLAGDDFDFEDKGRMEKIITKKAVIKTVDPETKIDNEIIAEADRCLECNYLCNKCVEVCPNRANVAIKVNDEEDAFQILHIDELCNECGNCGIFCPWIGAPYQNKPTLFGSDDDFNNSENSGFLIMANDTEIKIKYRFDSHTGIERLENLSKVNDSDDWISFVLLIKTVISDYKYLY